MKASSQTLIELAADRIDLVAWMKNLSDRDYQACSPAHRAAGAFYENGTFGTINVESVGGHLLVHHYLATELEPLHVVMHSRDTRVYIMHIMPATIAVTWTLEAQANDSRSSRFRCTVEVHMPAFLSVVANLGLLPLFLRRHVQGETPLFAQDLITKAASGRI